MQRFLFLVVGADVAAVLTLVTAAAVGDSVGDDATAAAVGDRSMAWCSTVVIDGEVICVVVVVVVVTVVVTVVFADGEVKRSMMKD
jgi:hypothetical protein